MARYKASQKKILNRQLNIAMISGIAIIYTTIFLLFYYLLQLLKGVTTEEMSRLTAQNTELILETKRCTLTNAFRQFCNDVQI